MRTLAVVALSLLVASVSAAEAAPHKHSAGKAHRAHRMSEPARHGAKHEHDVITKRGRAVLAAQLPVRGQSNGAPWAGSLHDAALLADGEGYEIRRPSRAFGTTKTIEIVSRVVTAVREEFPDKHVLGIGDISAEDGGAITQHHSHQSGRDIDIGLFYKQKPASYPRDFVRATADNLDCEGTFALLSGFARTAHENGGAQIIFLDYDVQGLIYAWAKDHDVDADRLERMFQYPHGRGSGGGLVRHYPGHDNHMHVRFKCPNADSSCR